MLSIYPDNKVHVAVMGPNLDTVGHKWAPYWSHAHCYQGSVTRWRCWNVWLHAHYTNHLSKKDSRWQYLATHSCPYCRKYSLRPGDAMWYRIAQPSLVKSYCLNKWCPILKWTNYIEIWMKYDFNSCQYTLRKMVTILFDGSRALRKCDRPILPVCLAYFCACVFVPLKQHFIRIVHMYPIEYAYTCVLNCFVLC